MTQRTIARLYDSYDHAQQVVTELEAAGVPHRDISLVANENTRNGSSTGHTTTAETAGGAGALLGTVAGGGVGLLAGIGALAIPGVGPVVAAGWLVATLTGAGIGAAAGGLVGALTGAGVNKEEAHVYAEGVRGGGSLVTVRVEDADAARAEEIMGRHGAVDWQQRRASYGPDWRGFDEARDPAADRLGSGANVPVEPAPGADPGRRL
nr:general stress protein [uncultured Rhodopila sp.]